ncbi:MAG: response regulator [Erythrobacter sp.]
MPLSQKISDILPYLRRYARALTGSQSTGDAFVTATLEAALADPALKRSFDDGRVAVYKAFNKVWSSAYLDVDANDGQTNGHEAAANQRLGAITPLNRQALLLTTVEEFSSAQAAEIMDLQPGDVDQLVNEAIKEIERESSTNVLIIEDEPLISMQLEDIVASLGHQICGTAATRTQAGEVAAQNDVGLVLADIQLADGSSGLDAVEDILSMGNVPVIFITAYPERLLTGDRPEPTYLVTKPFQERAVCAAISQALFFNSGTPAS